MGFLKNMLGLWRDLRQDEAVSTDGQDLDIPCRPPNITEPVMPSIGAREDPRVVKQRIMETRGVVSRRVVVDTDRCELCGNCVHVCPDGAVTVTKVKVIDTDLCTTCGCCISTCPHQAIHMQEERGDEAVIP